MFDHQDEQNLFIGVFVVLGTAGVEAQVVPTTADAAIAVGIIPRGTNGLLGLFARLHVRHDDSPGTGIERALEILRVIPGDTDHRRDRRVRHRHEHLR